MIHNNSIQYRDLIVKSSFQPEKNKGAWKVYDVKEKALTSNRMFNNVNTSTNILAYLGIVDALQMATPHVITRVYCDNNVALIWAKNKFCNTKLKDKKFSRLITEANEYLRSNDFSHRLYSKVPRNLIPLSEASAGDIKS